MTMGKYNREYVIEFTVDERPEIGTFDWTYAIWDRSKHNIMFYRSGRGKKYMLHAHKDSSEWLLRIARAYNNNPTNDNNSEGATS